MENERQKMIEEVKRSDAAEALALRARGIPQRVGMAAAARILADEVTRAAFERIESQRAGGGFDQRLEETPDIPAADALTGILREEVVLIAEQIRRVGEQWLNDSLRLQGTAEALEGRIARLARIDEAMETTSQPVREG